MSKEDAIFKVQTCALNFKLYDADNWQKPLTDLKTGDTFKIDTIWKQGNEVAGYKVIYQNNAYFLYESTFQFNKNCVEDVTPSPVKPNQNKKTDHLKAGFFATLITSILTFLVAFLKFWKYVFSALVKLVSFLVKVLIDSILFVANQVVKNPLIFVIVLLILVSVLARIYANLGKRN